MDAAGGIAQPAPSRIGAVLILKHPLQHKDLLAAAMAMGLKDRAGRPAHQGHMFRAKGMQRHHLQTGHQPREPGRTEGVDGEALLISRVHLVQLHQERAALLTERRMAGAGGVAQVGAGGVVPMLI